MIISNNLNLRQKIALRREQILTLELLQMNPLDLEKEIEKRIVENFFLSPNFFKNRISPLPLEEKILEVESDKTLKELLKEQLSEIKIEKDLRKRIFFLIENLDERGFLSEMENLSFSSPKKWKKAHELLKSFTPLGCGTKNLKDFLDFQLKIQYKDIYKRKFQYLIQNSLEEIEKNLHLYRRFKIKKKEYLDFLKILKGLKPYPAQNFYTGQKSSAIYPEGILIIDRGDLYLKLNSYPKVNLNEEYANMDLSILSPKEKIKVLKMKKEASEFIDALNFRNKTLEKAITSIVNRQRQHILGNSFLVPYLLKDLSSDLSLHTSTLSRCLRDRYILMPDHTLRKIKSFFCRELHLRSCDEIKLKITNLIAEEDIPLKDEELVALLQDEKIDISRRTVAKYRKQLNIPSSYIRKKEKIDDR